MRPVIYAVLCAVLIEKLDASTGEGKFLRSVTSHLVCALHGVGLYIVYNPIAINIAIDALIAEVLIAVTLYGDTDCNLTTTLQDVAVVCLHIIHEAWQFLCHILLYCLGS